MISDTTAVVDWVLLPSLFEKIFCCPVFFFFFFLILLSFFSRKPRPCVPADNGKWSKQVTVVSAYEM